MRAGSSGWGNWSLGAETKGSAAAFVNWELSEKVLVPLAFQLRSVFRKHDPWKNMQAAQLLRGCCLIKS